MKEYDVLVPIAGYAIVRVEADSEEAAIDAAMEKEIRTEDIETWDSYEHITEGNVFHAEENDARVLDEYDDDEEDP